MRRMLEFVRTTDADDGWHVLRTGAGSQLRFRANGAPPPGRLLLLPGSRQRDALAVTVTARDTEGRPTDVQLPGSAAATLRYAPLDRPAADAADAVLLLPIADVPSAGTPAPVPAHRRATASVRATPAA